MTPKEKRMLILNPLLEELGADGYFMYNGYLYRVDRAAKYCVAIHVQLYSNGCIKQVSVAYGTFYRKLEFDRRYGVALGELVMLGSIPGWHLCSNAKEADAYCRDAAEEIVGRMKKVILPGLRRIKDIPSFIKVAEDFDGFHPMALWQEERAWDYMAIGQRERAYQFLDSLIHHPLYEAEGLPHNTVTLCQLLDQLHGLDDKSVQMELEKRVVRSEHSCQDFFGVRRWNTISNI